MLRSHAKAVLLGSTVILVGTIAAWLTVGESGDGRVDLVGPAVTTTSVASNSNRLAPTSNQTSTTLPSPFRNAIVPPLPEPGIPKRLTIPAIGLDATIDAVGLLPDGQMQVPPADRAGWYSLGPLPGSAYGSAVIAGHIDYNKRLGVFSRLDDLQVGTEVVVLDSTESAFRYRVTERYQVSKQQLPRAELFRTGGLPVLTLITCGGTFDSDRGHYDDNIVVRAAPVHA